MCFSLICYPVSPPYPILSLLSRIPGTFRSLHHPLSEHVYPEKGRPRHAKVDAVKEPRATLRRGPNSIAQSRVLTQHGRQVGVQVYEPCGAKHLRRQLVPTLKGRAVVKGLVTNEPLRLFERFQGPRKLPCVAICDARNRIVEENQRVTTRPGP